MKPALSGPDRPLRGTSQSPEEAELVKKLEELTALESRLADLEFQLFNLRLELDEFYKVYSAEVGPFFAGLDEIEALLAEKIAQASPGDTKAAAAADAARRQAEESRQAAANALATPTPRQTRSDSLRDLYRQAAKKMHPDLSRDDADRKIRERLMTEANLAYEKGDEARLRAVLEEYESSPDSVIGNDVASELVRALRRISLANKRIKQVEAEIAELKASKLFTLKTQVEDGTRIGKDVLGEMVKQLQRQIQAKREQLRTM